MPTHLRLVSLMAARSMCSLAPNVRAKRAPTAGHQARSGGTRYIFASPGLASCRRRPLSSNVRRQRTHAPRGHQREQPKMGGHLRAACYPYAVKVSEILRLLQQDGWVLVVTRGSHRQYKHGTKPGRVTVPGKPSDDIAPGTQNSILKQAGLK